MPTRKQIIMFLLTNDARLRSSQRNVLTKKILKTLRKENPETYRAFYGSLFVILGILCIAAAMMILDDEAESLDLYIFTIVGTMVAAVPVVYYTGFKMFETYFKKYPEDFPND